MKHKNVLILGAGYTGIASAVELTRNKVPFTLVESESYPAGLSRTIHFKGVKFELGPHIYFDKDPEVNNFWKEFAKEKFKTYRRNNRIFYNGLFIKSPLSIPDIFVKLGPFKIAELLFSFLVSKISNRKKDIRSAEDWVRSNFGDGLYNAFFKVYNEKIWGIPCSEISADWSGQRIKASLFAMVLKSLISDKDFIIKTFNFPDGGSETLYQAQLSFIQKFSDAQILYNTRPLKISYKNDVFEVTLNNNTTQIFTHVISTISLESLFEVLEGPINYNVAKEALSKLLYRNLILVNLIFNKSAVLNFKEHWIDVHDNHVTALRVTNFGNYNFGLSTEEKIGIGVEYNCFEKDQIWEFNDEKIYDLCLKDLKYMNLISEPAIEYQVVRVPKAYPVYFIGYENYTSILFQELQKMNNLYLAGRNAMYKWNNMHHSVKTGILAAKNVLGEKYNLFKIKSMVAIGKLVD